MLNQSINRIKSWLEKWQHRLKGHMLISGKYMSSGNTFQIWVVDIYTSENGKWFADRADGITIPLNSALTDYTITSA